MFCLMRPAGALMTPATEGEKDSFQRPWATDVTLDKSDPIKGDISFEIPSAGFMGN